MPIYRKYAGVFDILPSNGLRRPGGILVGEFAPCRAWQSMAVHRSQFVWYRKLFVVFSRYAYMNSINPVE